MNNAVKEEETALQRDENGNVIFPKSHKAFWAYDNWFATQVFKEWNDERQDYRPLAEIFMEEHLTEKKDEIEREKIITYRLFPFPEKPVTEDFIRSNWEKYCAYFYFKEVLKYRNFNGSMGTDYDLRTIVLRKSTFDEIKKLIEENSLQKVHDIIFFLIAKIQDTYFDEIEFWEQPDMVKMVNNAEAETEKLMNVIDRVRPDNPYDRDRERKPDLKNISFVFPDIHPVKIQDPWLNNYIIDSIKEYYGKRRTKNWRKELISYGKGFKEEKDKQQFRFHLAIALHNFFQDQKLFPAAKGKMASNAELLCIAKILEFGLIKIGSEGISDAEKIKNVRNFIKPQRHKLEIHPTHVPATLDIERLSKYFDKDFLTCVPMIKSMESLGVAFMICERFDMQHLFQEVTHIMDCIQHRMFQIGWQFSYLDHPEHRNTTIQTLHNFVTGATRGKITEVSFKVEGNGDSQTIKETQPLTLIERALTEYYKNHQEEFEVDLMATNVVDDVPQQSFCVIPLDKYQEQKDRFLPRLCSQLYKFLLVALPPGKYEYNVTRKYTLIIGLILQRSWVFKHQNDDEHTVQQKVLQWLNDSKGIN